MALSRGNFKNVSYKALDSNADNKLQNNRGEIRASNLYFSLGTDDTSLFFPDSNAFAAEGFTLRDNLADDILRPEDLSSALQQVIVGSGSDAIHTYLDSTSPIGTKFGDVDSSGSITISDSTKMLKVAAGTLTGGFDSAIERKFGYWAGKDNSPTIPDFPGEIRSSHFQGLNRIYTWIEDKNNYDYGTSTYAGNHYAINGNRGLPLYVWPSGIPNPRTLSDTSGYEPPDASGFGYRVGLMTEVDGNGDYEHSWLVITNPFNEGTNNTNNGGTVQVWKLSDEGYRHWTHIQGNSGNNTWFGYSLDVDRYAENPLFVVGAPFTGTIETGQISVYNVNGVLQRVYNHPDGSTTNGFFGSTVAINSLLDRVAAGYSTIQYSNDATYGYHYGKVFLGKISSQTSVAEFDNPYPKSITFGTPAANFWAFGANPFSSKDSSYNDGTNLTFTASMLHYGPPEEGVSPSHNSYDADGVGKRGMQNLAFGGDYLYVGNPGGNTITNGGQVLLFNATTGSYVNKSQAGGTGGGYGCALAADSDGVIVGDYLNDLYGGQVFYRNTNSAFSNKDDIEWSDSPIDVWGFDKSTNASRLGQYVAKSKKYTAVWANGANNSVGSASDEAILIFENSGSTTFDTLYKVVTMESLKSLGPQNNANRWTGQRNIYDFDINDKYLVIGCPKLKSSSLLTTPHGVVFIFDIDLLPEIVLTGDEPSP